MQQQHAQGAHPPGAAVVIGIGGGVVARDELLAAKRFGKEVRFIPADMHHQKAREKAQKKRLPVPTHFGGAAAAVFSPSVQD